MAAKRLDPLADPAALRAAHAQLIASAGIPVDQHQAVLDGLESSFEIYARRGGDANPAALQGVIDAAENAGKTELWDQKLRDRIAALPLGLRFSIFPYLGYTGGPDGRHIAGELSTGTVLARAKELRGRIQRGRGRPPSELAKLLFDLQLMFEPFFPGGGVTKNSSKADKFRADGGPGQDYLYRGALLDLVQKLLDVEGVDYESRGAIGRELWDFVQGGKKLEQRRATGLCARCDNPLPNPEDPEQVYCATCHAQATPGGAQ